MKINRLALIFGIVILVILVLIGIFVYNQIQKNKEIESMNKIQYNFLKCISNCSIIHFGNQSSFSQTCYTNCRNNYTAPANLTTKYVKEQLMRNWDYVQCGQKIDVRIPMAYENYQTCLISLFPKLEQKYGYLKKS